MPEPYYDRLVPTTIQTGPNEARIFDDREVNGTIHVQFIQTNVGNFGKRVAFKFETHGELARWATQLAGAVADM